jgi:Tfp pilus assembly protein PilO
LLRQKCNTLEQQRQRDLAVIAGADEVRAQHAAARQQLRSLNETLADLKIRLPAAPNEAEFLAQLSAVSERSAVRLRNFRPGQATSHGAVSSSDVQLSLVGSFAHICSFLNGLSEVPRYLSVSRLSLAGPPKPGDPCVADLTISLSFAPVQNKP